MEITNSVVANAVAANASRVARNGYVDVYTIAKQEWNRAYRGNEPFGIDAVIKPNGDFKIQEVAQGKVDDSEVNWNPIADKVKRALLAAGNKSAVVKVNPYGNGIMGNLGIARNACGTARNASGSSFYAAYAGKAKAAMQEIKYDAEGDLRVLSGHADELVHKAREAGDDKGANDIIRCQGLLEDALANYVRVSLRTIG